MVVVGVSALSRSLTNLTTSVRPVLLARLAYRPFTYGSIAQSSLRLVRSFSSDHPAREVDEPRDPSTIRNVAIIAHVDVSVLQSLKNSILRAHMPQMNTSEFPANSNPATGFELCSMANLRSVIKFYAIALSTLIRTVLWIPVILNANVVLR